MQCSVSCCLLFFFYRQKTAYEMRISDWSSDVCSSDLGQRTASSRRAAREDRGSNDTADARRHRENRRVRCRHRASLAYRGDRKSVVWGKSVSVSVELGGRRMIKKKINNSEREQTATWKRLDNIERTHKAE